MFVLKRNNAFSNLLAVAIGLTAYAFALSGGNLGYLAISQLAVGGIFVLALSMNPNFRRIPSKNILVWSLFITSLLLNIVININNYSNADFGPLAARIAGLSMLLLILQWSAVALNPVRIMVSLGLTLTPLVFYATGVSLVDSEVERAAPLAIHPNWWGELLFCYSACALVTPNKIIKLTMLGVALLLFYLVQSRGAFVASMVTAGIYLSSSARVTRWNIRRGILGCIALVLAVIALIWWIGLTRTADFLSDEVLFLNHEYRGIDSGFVGRLDGWWLAWQAFLANPIFGQGLDTMTDVHNGFLRLMAEGGIVMLVSVLWLSWAGIIAALRTGNHIGFAVIIGYFVMVLFAPRFLNMNLASTVFFLSIFPWCTVEYAGQSRSTKRPLSQS